MRTALLARLQWSSALPSLFHQLLSVPTRPRPQELGSTACGSVLQLRLASTPRRLLTSILPDAKDSTPPHRPSISSRADYCGAVIELSACRRPHQAMQRSARIFLAFLPLPRSFSYWGPRTQLRTDCYMSRVTRYKRERRGRRLCLVEKERTRGERLLGCTSTSHGCTDDGTRNSFTPHASTITSPDSWYPLSCLTTHALAYSPNPLVQAGLLSSLAMPNDLSVTGFSIAPARRSCSPSRSRSDLVVRLQRQWFLIGSVMVGVARSAL